MLMRERAVETIGLGASNFREVRRTAPANLSSNPMASTESQMETIPLGRMKSHSGS